ncbi:MAG: hypothetical protein ACK54H_12040, partial [Phycisphaerales bacterium]
APSSPLPEQAIGSGQWAVGKTESLQCSPFPIPFAAPKQWEKRITAMLFLPSSPLPEQAIGSGQWAVGKTESLQCSPFPIA